MSASTSTNEVPALPTPDQRSRLSLLPGWNALKGFGYGLREPVVLGRVQVALTKIVEFGRLDAAIARYIIEELPEDIDNGSNAERLVVRVLHWAAALQREVRIPIFGRAYVSEPIKRDDGSITMCVAVPYFSAHATTVTLSWVTSAVNYFLRHGRLTQATDEATEKQNFEKVVAHVRKFLPGGVNTFRFLAAAHECNIPAHQLIPSAYAYGEGVHTRWLQSSFSDRTGVLGANIGGNKLLTAHMMRRAGLPTPQHAQARSEQEAVQIAERLGYPVVVKPADLRQGIGVATDLGSDSAVVSAFKSARSHSPNILVEKHFQGEDYRITVVNGQVIDAYSRTPGGVVGDGQHTITQLIDIARAQPRYIIWMRQRGYDALVLDEEARTLLRAAGLTPESIPAENQYVKLRRRGNLSAGGTRKPLDLYEIHPDNRRLAEQAVAAIKLDIGGVDVMMPDISRSWMDTGAIINEVNAQPQLGTDLARKVLQALIAGDGRIPVLLVVGQSGCIDWQSLRQHLPTSKVIGFASADGAWLKNERLTLRQENGFAAARILFDSQETEAAVIVMEPNEIRRLGLPTVCFEAMILDNPDKWGQEGRDATAQMLNLTMPHAKWVVTLSPAHPLFANSPFADRWETASGAIIQDVCANVAKHLFADLAEAPIQVASRPSQSSG